MSTIEFGAHTTADEVLEGLDLRGRRAIVTGASSGIGVETARALAEHGASVVLGVRDVAKGEAVAESIASRVPDADVEVRLGDLESLASVRDFADGLLGDGRGVDFLIANAGVMASPFRHTAEGYELQFGTNHLGHFLLVNLLTPLLLTGAPSRVVSLTSSGHRYSDVDLDDPNFERTAYDPYRSYGRSKTANVLFAVEFDRRWRDRGVRAFAVHPGMIRDTDLKRHIVSDRVTMDKVVEFTRALNIQDIEAKSVAAGAATSVFAATSPTLDGKGGLYLEDCQVAKIDDEPAQAWGVRSYALDPERAAALWSLSEQLVGQTFSS
jgi:NAD(P)-dependent dehydrogenase (short-subunit alcohol dehydrogenase family)